MDHHGDGKSIPSEGGTANEGRGKSSGGELGVFWSIRGLGCGVAAAAPEMLAVAVYLQDVHVVGEPVQQGSGETLRAEDPGTLVEGEVGGEQDGTSLIALAEDFEEEFSTGAR